MKSQTFYFHHGGLMSMAARDSVSLSLRDYVIWEINAFLWISYITITFLLLREFNTKILRLLYLPRKIPGPPPPCPSFSGISNSKLFSGSNSQENLTDKVPAELWKQLTTENENQCSSASS